MINKESILRTAQTLVQQYNLPLKIKGVEPASPAGGEGTEEVTIYFSAAKKVRLRELEQELELQLSHPIKLERVKKSESGKIGGVDILGNYPCCAPFLRKCPFGGKYGCGYGFGVGKKEDRGQKTEIREQKTEDGKHPKPQKKAKSKKKKVVRRLVLTGRS